MGDEPDEPRGMVSSVAFSIATLFKPRTGGELAAFVPDPSPPAMSNPLAPGQQPVVIRPSGRLRRVGIGGVLGAAWFSPDGGVFAAGGGNKKLTLYDVDSGDEITAVTLGGTLRATAVAAPAQPGGSCRFACGGDDSVVAVFTLEPEGSGDDRVSDGWPTPFDPTAAGQKDGAVNACAFSQDGELLAVGWVKGVLRVFDSATGAVKNTLEVGAGTLTSGCLHFTRNYLVGSSAAISQEEPVKASTVTFWTLADDFRQARMIEYSSAVQAFAIEPNELGFAVGTGDGAVRLYSSTEDKNPWLLKPGYSASVNDEKKGAVSSVAFGQVRAENSTMATLFAIGWRNGQFAIYDHSTLTQIAGFLHFGTNNGYICCFSPDGGTIATGGGNSEVVLHRTRPVEPLGIVPQQGKLVTSAFVAGGMAAVALGNQVNVYDCSGGGSSRSESTKPVMSVKAEEELRHLVEISPDGKLLAFSQRSNKSAKVYDIASQSEVTTLAFKGGCDGVRWSPAGSYLVAWGGFGAKVFDTASFNEIATISDPNYYVGDCIVSPDEKLIATCGASAQVNLRRLPNPSEEPLVSIQEDGFTAAVCFNPVSPDGSSDQIQIAYSAAGGTNEHVRVCNVDLGTKATSEVYRLGEKDTLGPWDQQGSSFKGHPKAFSPDGKYLLCWNSQGSQNEGGVTILDTDPDPGSKSAGRTVPWSSLLATILHDASDRKCSVHEGGGTPTARFGVGWVPDADQPSLYFGCGKGLITVDVGEVKLAAEDGCFSAGQLSAATGFRQDLVHRIAQRCPHAINMRELRLGEEGSGAGGRSIGLRPGDTVIHYCARNLGLQNMLAAWLQVDSKGDELPNREGQGNFYYPIANGDPKECSSCGRGKAGREGAGRFGATALHCAIASSSEDTILLLCKRLTNRIGPPHAVLLNDTLALLAITLPELVSEVLNTLDDKLLQPQELLCEHLGHDDAEQLGSTVRLAINREEVRGSAAYMATKHLPHDVLKNREHVWRGFQTADPDAVQVPVSAHVVALAGFLGNPTKESTDVSLTMEARNTNNRTYTLIVENCESDVFHCRIMKLATQFKWEESVHPMQVKMMCMYLFCTLCATAGMVSCTHEYNYLPPIEAGSSESGVTVAVAGTSGRFPWYNLALVSLVCLTELGVLLNEFSQFMLEGFTKYWRSPWNICDLISSVSLLTATCCHFVANKAPDDWDHNWWEDGVSTFGAVGVLFKWVGMMDYMRLWQTTAARVRM